MKKIILSLSILAIAGATIFVACKKGESVLNNPTKTSSNNTQRTQSPYDLITDSIGTIHNQGLEYAFNKIKNQNLFVGLNDSSRVVSLITQLTKEYLNLRLAYIPVTYSNGFADSIITGVINKNFNSNNYSIVYKQKMTELMNYYNSASNPNDYKQFAISFLENNLSSIPDSEQLTFKTAISVSYNSWEYWNVNLVLWVKEYERQNGERTGDKKDVKVNVKDVGKADIEGCIEGAIGGAFAGGLVGACLGAPLGAIGNSLKSAIWQVIWP